MNPNDTDLSDLHVPFIANKCLIPSHDALFAEDGTISIKLADGGYLYLADQQDGTYRLAIEDGDVTFSKRIATADVWNLRAATGHMIVGRLREAA